MGASMGMHGVDAAGWQYMDMGMNMGIGINIDMDRHMHMYMCRQAGRQACRQTMARAWA